jgi:hypothetical protein
MQMFLLPLADSLGWTFSFVISGYLADCRTRSVERCHAVNPGRGDSSSPPPTPDQQQRQQEGGGEDGEAEAGHLEL